MKKDLIIIVTIVLIFMAWFGYVATQKTLVPPLLPIPSATKITYSNATADLIKVETPTPGATTGQVFSVRGQARGTWFFEGSFSIVVLDKSGQILAQSLATSSQDWMTANFIPFKADFKIPASYIGPATLVLKKDNPSGLPEHEASISFPITIQNLNGQALTKIYSNQQISFSLTLPKSENYKVDEAYFYQNLGPGKDIAGVKFTIPVTLTTGTNLSPDSYLSVESLPQTTNCSASLFLSIGAKISTITEKGVSYSVGKVSGAAAGNRYDETVYALSGTNPCVAVLYFIHYSVFANYPAGTIKEFDQMALIKQFDQIRRTLVVN